MATAWTLLGRVRAGAAGDLVSLTGGERIEAGGRGFDVAPTPGHASHHVSYFDGSSGVAFVGDTAGVCINGGYVSRPRRRRTSTWNCGRGASTESWPGRPTTLMLTHFGPVTDVRPHLATLLENLQTTSGIALSRSMSRDATRNEVARLPRSFGTCCGAR